jgi:hypothetical protein
MGCSVKAIAAREPYAEATPMTPGQLKIRELEKRIARIEMAFAVHTSGLMVLSSSALIWSLRVWCFSAMRSNSGRFDSK